MIYSKNIDEKPANFYLEAQKSTNRQFGAIRVKI